ncbi:MAG: hypothetical protein WBI58_06695, partial [Dysgonamonadaceae bacterium]
AVILSLILNMLLILDPKEKIINKETKQNSFFYKRIQIVVPTFVPYINGEVWKQYIPGEYKGKTIQTFSPTRQTNQNRQQLC